MTHSTTHKWSQEVTDHSDRRESGPYRSAMSMFTNRAGAQVPEREKDALRTTLYQRPSSGRTTPLGRRVEKPGSGNPAGPSGQRDRAKHDGKHTNK
jgi:hypothetical protein